MEEPKKKRPLGRPTLYNPDLMLEFCIRISEGESVLRLCKEEKFPSYSTIMSWLNDSRFEHHAAFLEMYKRARNFQMDYIAEKAKDDAEEAGNLTFVDQHGVERVDNGAVQAARLMFDARRWYASKVAPHKYGDKIEVENTGEQRVSIFRFATKKDLENAQK